MATGPRHFCQAFNHQAIIVRAVCCHYAQCLTRVSLQGDLKCSPLEVILEAASEEAETAGHGPQHAIRGPNKFHGTGGRVCWLQRVEASVNPAFDKNGCDIRVLVAASKSSDNNLVPPPWPLPSVLEELPWKLDHFIGVALPGGESLSIINH